MVHDLGFFKPSHVNDTAVGVENAFVHHFGKCWMWEDCMHQFFFRGLEAHGQYEALDQFRDLSTHHVRTNQATSFGIENGFDQALIFAQCDGFAVGEERELANLEFIASSFRLGFGEADARHLRVAIGAAGDLVFLHRVAWVGP